VYDIVSRHISFIDDLCSGSSLSGALEDTHCPSETGVDTGLWISSGNQSEAQTASINGRYLLFSSYAQLTADDTDATKDVYRYDAETGAVERVSVGENGYDANGNNDNFNSSMALGHHGGSVRFQYELDVRAITEDGSRVIFTTTEPLSARAINHLANVYEWHQGDSGAAGSVSLISDGSADTSIEDDVIGTGGNDVFFVTTQGLIPGDADDAPDVYDARLGGGFPPQPAPRKPCSSDACQGPLTNPVPLLVPSSVSQAPGENLDAPAKMVTSKKMKKKPKASKKKTKKRKRASRSHHSSKAARHHGRKARHGERG
jgi:hypothetical protein